MCQGRFGLDIRKRFFPRGWLGPEQAPQVMVTVPRLTEPKKHLENTLRHRVGLLGRPVQGQQLDLMILVGPIQLRICYDPMIIWLLGTK